MKSSDETTRVTKKPVFSFVTIKAQIRCTSAHADQDLFVQCLEGCNRSNIPSLKLLVSKAAGGDWFD